MDRAFSPEFPREPLSRVDFILRLYRLFCTQSRMKITECQSAFDFKEKHLLSNRRWVIWNTFVVRVFGLTQKSILKVLEHKHELYKSFNEVYSQTKNVIMSNGDKQRSEVCFIGGDKWMWNSYSFQLWRKSFSTHFGQTKSHFTEQIQHVMQQTTAFVFLWHGGNWNLWNSYYRLSKSSSYKCKSAISKSSS